MFLVSRIVSQETGEEFAGMTSVKGRGNITWKRYPKKPYSLKLTKKAEVLGMAAAKRWVLLSNWADRTLLRNEVAFEVARRTSLAWTPQGRPVTPRDDIYTAERFPYLKRLFLNETFRHAVRLRWKELQPKMESIPDYIDQQADLIRLSAQQNILMWPISLTLNGDEQMTFDEAIERMKQSFLLRMSVIAQYLSE